MKGLKGAREWREESSQPDQWPRDAPATRGGGAHKNHMMNYKEMIIIPIPNRYHLENYKIYIKIIAITMET